MLWVWEGNRRSGVALAMRHRHSEWFGLNSLGKGDDPRLTLHWSTTEKGKDAGVQRHLYLFLFNDKYASFVSAHCF